MKNDNRIQIIAEYASSRTSLFEHSLIPALTNCLEPEEVILMLSICDEQKASVRRALLNKMERDVSENVSTQKYLTLAPILIDRYKTVLSKKRGAISTCLDRMMNMYPIEQVEDIFTFFLTNKHVGMRRKAFKYLKENWDDSFQEPLMKIWELHSDTEANSLIVTHFDRKTIGKHIKRILAINETAKYKIPVYKELASKDMKYVAHLDSNDKITATYLRAINNVKISLKTAKKLTETEIGDERYGLLLWSLGKLGHWSALVHAHKLLRKNIASNKGLELTHLQGSGRGK